MRDDDAQAVSDWAAQHSEEINRMYERRRDTLRGLQRELRVRHILLSFPDGATDAQKAETRAKAAAVRARLVGGEDFVRLARLYSGDPGAGARAATWAGSRTRPSSASWSPSATR